MLIRLISVIALINFMLLLISGSSVDIALYRSVLIFLILFTVVYLAMFFLNVIRQDVNSTPSTVSESGPNQDLKNKGKSS